MVKTVKCYEMRMCYEGQEEIVKAHELHLGAFTGADHNHSIPAGRREKKNLSLVQRQLPHAYKVSANVRLGVCGQNGFEVS